MAKRKCTEDPFVKAIGEDGHQGDVEVLSGFLGESPMDGMCRLYLSADLSSYFEFPESAVVHWEEGGGKQSARNSTVWLKKDTRVTTCKITNLRDERASFLGGSLMSTVLPRTNPSHFSAHPSVAEIPTWVICGFSTLATVVIVFSRATTDTACCSSCCCTAFVASTCS